MIFEALWLFVKVLSTKFGSVGSFSGTSKQSVKVFLPLICKSFLPQNFPTIRTTCMPR